MHLPTHALASWLLAEAAPLSNRQRALVLAAGLVPDLDALTLLGGIEVYQRWHRVILHNGLSALLCAALFAALGARPAAGTSRDPVERAPPLLCALLVFASFHLHLLGDLLGSAGPAGSVATPDSRATIVERVLELTGGLGRPRAPGERGPSGAGPRRRGRAVRAIDRADAPRGEPGGGGSPVHLHAGAGIQEVVPLSRGGAGGEERCPEQCDLPAGGRARLLPACAHRRLHQRAW
jgi:hypothetical protein